MQSRDRDSQIRGARLLGSSTRGSLNQRNDRDDLFRFNLSGRSSVNLELSGITRRTNADVELYRLNRPLQDVVRSIGRVSFRMLRGTQRSQNLSLVASSRRGGNRSEQVSTTLEAGDYIVRVLQRQGNSRYQLSFRSTVILPPPPPENPVPVPTPTPGPSPTPTPGPAPTPTPAPAIPLAIPTANAITGNVGGARPLVDYSFSVADSRDLEFNLSGLTGDADVAILAADRATVLRTSSNLGANPERFIQTLPSGGYFLRVFRKDATVNTNFQLRVTPLTDAVNGDTEVSAVPITFNPTTQTFTQSNYVGENTQSPFDYYQFTTPVGQAQFLTAQMTGLFDNLDIELYSPSDPTTVLQSNKAGASEETFGGTLAGGTTYILKVASGAVAPGATPAGSTYNLSLRLSPTQSRPSVSRDISFGPNGSGIERLTAAGSRAYFIANDGSGKALWVSDGTLNGTRSIRRFDEIGAFATVDGILYFSANDGVSGTELWRSDGTAAGTRIVQDYRPGTGNLNPQEFTVVGNRLYFLGQSAGVGSVNLFYLSSNAQSPIQEVITATSNPNVEALNVGKLTAIGDTLYFTSSERIGATSNSGLELMRIQDADNSTTIQRIDVFENLGPSTPEASSPTFLTAVGNSLFFQARRLVEGAARTELVRFTPGDGVTTVDTLTTFDVPPNDLASTPANLINIDGTLYFTASGENASGADIGNELWALPNAETALETQAPVLVGDINPGSSSNASDLVNLNGALYFLADDGNGKALWRAQQDSGTFTTAKVSSIVASRLDGVEIADAAEKTDLMVVGQGAGAYLYFVGTRAGDTELWFTNGTETGTGVFNINSTASSNPDQLTNINGRLFFVATTPERGAELWTFQGIPNPS
ncbi:ELWxxDGT repeat protein [Leptolyngbya ohadii]|uniref:ELWxxDGT repeat protein n=1 Tax=Leptolyngbya ohadii TaxID=1962290 RepID=UPI0015C692A0|nr:ELWxxDGT repeat protein [Leptolyngbya ohadii]